MHPIPASCRARPLTWIVAFYRAKPLRWIVAFYRARAWTWIVAFYRAKPLRWIVAFYRAKPARDIEQPETQDIHGEPDRRLSSAMGLVVSAILLVLVVCVSIAAAPARPSARLAADQNQKKRDCGPPQFVGRARECDWLTTMNVAKLSAIESHAKCTSSKCSKRLKCSKRFTRCAGQGKVGALDVADVALGLTMTAFDAAQPGDSLLERVITIGALAGVRVAGAAFSRLGRGDVHVVRRGELDRVFAVGDLVVVEGEPLSQPEPGVIDQHRDGAVVGVVVDRPVGENHVGLLGLDDFAECLVMGGVDDGLAVELARVPGSAFKISQAFGLCHPARGPQSRGGHSPRFRYRRTTSCPRSV